MLFKIQDVIQVCVNANLRTMFNILSMQKRLNWIRKQTMQAQYKNKNKSELDTKINNPNTKAEPQIKNNSMIRYSG